MIVGENEGVINSEFGTLLDFTNTKYLGSSLYTSNRVQNKRTDV